MMDVMLWVYLIAAVALLIICFDFANNDDDERD